MRLWPVAASSEGRGAPSGCVATSMARGRRWLVMLGRWWWAAGTLVHARGCSRGDGDEGDDEARTGAWAGWCWRHSRTSVGRLDSEPCCVSLAHSRGTRRANQAPGPARTASPPIVTEAKMVHGPGETGARPSAPRPGPAASSIDAADACAIAASVSLEPARYGTTQRPPIAPPVALNTNAHRQRPPSPTTAHNRPQHLALASAATLRASTLLATALSPQRARDRAW